MRRESFLGRLGSVFLAIGLALAIASVVPPSSAGGVSFQAAVSPGTYWVMDSGVFTPENGVNVITRSNSSIVVYLLGVSQSELTSQGPTGNLSTLNAFVQAQPKVILWRSSLASNFSHSFFPVGISNITAVVSNPSPNTANPLIFINYVTALAPIDRVLPAAGILILTGVALAWSWKVGKKTVRG